MCTEFRRNFQHGVGGCFVNEPQFEGVSAAAVTPEPKEMD